MNKEKTWLYSFARLLAKFIYGVIFRAKARGLENFPNDTNCILIGNHISAWDPITLAHFYTYSEVHFIAKDSLFKFPVLRTLLKWLHAFPVSRGERDMAAMRTCMQVLRDGHVLGVFPQGTRQEDGRVEAVETGIAVMALKSNVPVVPVRIGGRYKLFGKVRASVGKPIPLDDLRATRADSETLEEVKRRVIDALEALRPSMDF